MPNLQSSQSPKHISTDIIFAAQVSAAWNSAMYSRAISTVAIFVLAIVCLSGCGGGSSGGDSASEQVGSATSGGSSSNNDSDAGDDSTSPANSDDADSGSTDTGTASPSGSGSSGTTLAGTLRITTFNAGLLPTFVALTDERAQVVGPTLAAYDSDVLCIQEVWRPEDMQRISGQLAQSYPFMYSAPAKQKFAAVAPVCEEDDFDDMLVCLTRNCTASNEGFVECAQTNCSTELFALAAKDPQCAEAVFAQAGRSLSDSLDILDELFSSRAKAGLFAFGGSNGLLLASKYPLRNTEVADFFDASTTSRRAALFATIELNGEAHHVACTHLTSNLDGLLPYTGPFGSWQGEGKVQAERLLLFAEQYSASGPKYLAGDFNCSFANTATGVSAEFEDNCRRFVNAGYLDPSQGLSCSFCTSNPLNQQNSSIAGNKNVLLDHVFIKDTFSDDARAAIVLNQSVSAGGSQVPPSDHYGVEVSTPTP